MRIHALLLMPLLFFTACSDPIPVSVKDSPHVLRGAWSGTFGPKPPVETQQVSSRIPLVLNLTAAFLNRDHYHFEGTATFGEQHWKVRGTGSGMLIEFKQATSSELTAEGTFQDLQGNTVADFRCGHAFLFPGYDVEQVRYTCWVTGSNLDLVGELQRTP